MAKGGVDAQRARLAALPADLASPEAHHELRSALRSRINLFAAKSARLVARHRLPGFESDLAGALRAFLAGADKGCVAKTTITNALTALEARRG